MMEEVEIMEVKPKSGVSVGVLKPGQGGCGFTQDSLQSGRDITGEAHSSLCLDSVRSHSEDTRRKENQRIQFASWQSKVRAVAALGREWISSLCCVFFVRPLPP